MTSQEQPTINSIARAFHIIRLFEQSWELGIQEISQRTGLNKTTVFRIVKSLEANGVLIQNPMNSKYYPGFSILELAHNIYKNYDMKNLFTPYMEQLHNEFNEDVVLTILTDNQAVCIDRLEGDNTIHLHSRVGRRMLLCGGSTARVFLPYLSESALQDVLTDIESMAQMNQPTTRQELESCYDFVKEHGYLTSCSVTDEGVFSVSVPIRRDASRVYSLGICGIKDRLCSKGVDTLIQRLLTYGDELSQKMEHFEYINK